MCDEQVKCTGYLTAFSGAFWLELLRNVAEPHARALEHLEDADGVADDLVRRDVGRARDHQFTRAFDPSRLAAIWKNFEAPGRCLDPLVNGGGGLRVILCNPNIYRQMVGRGAD